MEKPEAPTVVHCAFAVMDIIAVNKIDSNFTFIFLYFNDLLQI